MVKHKNLGTNILLGLPKSVWLLTRASFMCMSPVLSHWALHLEGCHTCFNTLQSSYLKFLMILSLNLCSVSEEWWDNESSVWAEDMHEVCISTIPSHSVHIHSSQCPMSREFQRTQGAQKFCVTQNKLMWLSIIYSQVSKGNDSLESQTFHLDQN